ncbi:hypothetical protein [Streptomyces sp. SID8358]|uniref:hypothetical protein n=1 Tax=Streptomyces sp. SID8358 TaxID=2690342 RepID=UPI0015EBAA8C|nr:hypothetical protein [Streptomyces sp. SID8358]
MTVMLVSRAGEGWIPALFFAAPEEGNQEENYDEEGQRKYGRRFPVLQCWGRCKDAHAPRSFLWLTSPRTKEIRPVAKRMTAKGNSAEPEL